MKCPICGADLASVYTQSSEWGTEESLDGCPACKKYSEQYAYGSTQIYVGDFMTGYGYSDSEEHRTMIMEIVGRISAFYKEVAP